MDGIQGGRGNKDNCVVRGFNPHMILGFNTSASGCDNRIVTQKKDTIEGRIDGSGTKIRSDLRKVQR